MKQIILIFSLVISATVIFAQQSEQQNSIIEKEGRNYQYKNGSYGIYDLSPIFQDDEGIMNEYTEGIKSHKKGKTFGYITLGAIGVSVIGIASNAGASADCDNCVKLGGVIGLVSGIIVTPITGSIALLSHLKGKGKIRNAINTFNVKQYDDLGRVIEQPKLNFSKSGIGISVSF